jgi:hypothetical protein
MEQKCHVKNKNIMKLLDGSYTVGEDGGIKGQQ